MRLSFVYSQTFCIFGGKLIKNKIKMRKRILTAMVAWLVVLAAHANDGVYYVSGNQLVPLVETDIAIIKEVLTISLCDDGFARVDVYYVLYNNADEDTVEMGFEAQGPYNDGTTMNPKGTHPHIYDFTATMNGEKLTYRNAIVKNGGAELTDFKALDLKIWKRPLDNESDADILQNTKTGATTTFSYAYYFTANFKPGQNIVHHTYRYRMSNGVGRTFECPYWLTPATRWSNGKIEDFTLRIMAENTAKHFCLNENVFKGAEFKVIEGKGKVRHHKYGDYPTCIEIALRDGTVEWHKENFRPTEEMQITSVDAYISFDDSYPVGTFYDRSEHYHPNFIWDRQVDKRILRNLPYANRGYVFKDQILQAYFNSLWWYMPDPSWQTSSADFTASEWKLINENK